MLSNSHRNSGGNRSDEDEETFKPLNANKNSDPSNADARSKASDIKLFAALNKSRCIPPSLLSKVLPPEKIQMLSDEEKK